MGQPGRSEATFEDHGALGRVVANALPKPPGFLVRPRVAAGGHFVEWLRTLGHGGLLLTPSAQDPRDRIVDPWIDLEIAILGRGKTKLNRAIGTDKGPLGKTRRVLNADAQKPVAYRPAAQYTFFRRR
jgi:hypothetical protein